MKKRRSIRLKASDFFVIFFCLAVCVLSLFFFWKDLNRYTVREDQKPIAKILFRHKTAQRKFTDRVVWERVQNNTPLYNADTIRTSDLSQAVIEVNDGSQLEIYENTMIRIFESAAGISAVLSGNGNVTIKTTEDSAGLTLQLDNGSKIKLESGSTLNADTTKGDGEISVESGSAELFNTSGDSISIGSGEVASVSSSGDSKTKELNVNSIPKNYRVLNTSGKEIDIPVVYKVSDEYENEDIIFETSYFKDFSVIENTQTKKGSGTVDVKIKDRNVYWRLYNVESKENTEDFSEENNKLLSETGKITVSNIEKTQLLSPKNGTDYVYVDLMPSVNLSWTTSEWAASYKVEVAMDDAFNNIIVEKTESQGNTKINVLEKGKYFWRITPFYSVKENSIEDISETGTFTVTKLDKAEPPTLYVPADDSIVYSETSVADVVFNWKSQVKNAQYTFFLSDNPDFENCMVTEDTPNTSYAMKLQAFKEYKKFYWKVERSSASDIEKSVSKNSNFTLMLRSDNDIRLIYPVENYTIDINELPLFDFHWKSNSDVTLQVSSDEKFNTLVVQKTVTENSTRLNNIPEGKYFWRIKDANENQTEKRSFIVTKQLDSPQLIYPESEKILVVKNDSSVNFRWKEVTGADYYKFKLYKYKEDKPLVSFNSVKENSLSVELPKPVENENAVYSFSVQAVSEEKANSSERISLKSERIFSMRNRKTPLLLYPAEGVIIDGLTAIRKNTQFTWKDEEGGTKNLFVLKKIEKNGYAKTVKQIDNAKSGIEISRLTEGNYEWSYISDEQIQSRKFSVGKIPQLLKPILVNPSDRFEITPEYLRKNRNIVFEWAAVNGATDYVFDLYRITSDGRRKLLYEKKQRNRKITFTDLSMLDNGLFEWNVTALCFAKDGYLEQNGLTGRNVFTIHIPVPGQIKPKETEEQYGE